MAGHARFSSLVAAPGHGGLIRVLHPALFPQDCTCDLRNDVPLVTVGNRSVPMDCGPNVDQERCSAIRRSSGRVEASHRLVGRLYHEMRNNVGERLLGLGAGQRGDLAAQRAEHAGSFTLEQGNGTRDGKLCGGGCDRHKPRFKACGDHPGVFARERQGGLVTPPNGLLGYSAIPCRADRHDECQVVPAADDAVGHVDPVRGLRARPPLWEGSGPAGGRVCRQAGR